MKTIELGLLTMLSIMAIVTVYFVQVTTQQPVLSILTAAVLLSTVLMASDKS